MSRYIAENMLPCETVGVISITDPDSADAALRSGWLDVLRLRFHDISFGWQSYVLMSDDHARQVLRWLGEHAERMTGVVVHCEQGISRSAAVARFIAHHYGLIFDENDGRFFNPHVYDTLYACASA